MPEFYQRIYALLSRPQASFWDKGIAPKRVKPENPKHAYKNINEIVNKVLTKFLITLHFMNENDYVQSTKIEKFTLSDNNFAKACLRRLKKVHQTLSKKITSMRQSLKQKIIEICDLKIEKKGETVGLSFYAFFANKNDDPDLLMEAATWWIKTHKLDHFEKAQKIKDMVLADK
ncbi:DUF6500 family protein [Kiloniella spongiae]|nr:DUF6500 family protein [Kiloniella spongiae]